MSFKSIAQNEVSLCPLMAGREKLDTGAVLNKELTIIEFGFAPKFDANGNRVTDANGEIDEFGVVVFEEMPNSYYCVGTVMSKVCKAWAAEFGGDAEEASIALAEEGGVRVRFTESKTKRGNNITAVEIL